MRVAFALAVTLAACGGDEPTDARFAFELSIYRPAGGDHVITVDGDAAFTASAWAFDSYREGKTTLVLDLTATSNGGPTRSAEVRPGYCAERYDGPDTGLDIERIVLEQVELGPGIQGLELLGLDCTDADGVVWADVLD